ncbi:unnamed protein product, partial [Candidula unifasciata]
MATLVEGREYGLASNDLSQENKTIVHFKLTDTALKTLEDFSKNSRATIQFHGSEGVIKIPSHGNRPEQVFQISLSALPVDHNSSLDCIQQMSKHGESSLFSLGTMQNRITVLAKEDVFDRTKAKMTKVEEDNKKVCTKEIKPSGRHISKKVKKIIPAASLKYPQLVKKPSVVSLNGSPAAAAAAANRVQTYRDSPSPSSLSSSSSSLLSQGQNKLSPSASSNIPASKLSTTTTSRVLTSFAAKQTSGSINMPYRDRIIHLLALKPYKKPELLLRLQK